MPISPLPPRQLRTQGRSAIVPISVKPLLVFHTTSWTPLAVYPEPLYRPLPPEHLTPMARYISSVGNAISSTAANLLGSGDQYPRGQGGRGPPLCDVSMSTGLLFAPVSDRTPPSFVVNSQKTQGLTTVVGVSQVLVIYQARIS